METHSVGPVNPAQPGETSTSRGRSPACGDTGAAAGRRTLQEALLNGASQVQTVHGQLGRVADASRAVQRLRRELKCGHS